MPTNISLLEPSQYIASITGKTNLEIEFLIEKGQSYSLNNKGIPEGFLAVDAVFMPVRKVNFFIETSRNNSSLELESLILEIWTNGSITPAEALSSSAKMLELTFSALKLTDAASNTISTLEPTIRDGETDERYDTIFIEELELSVRAYNCLKRANIHTIEDLLKYSSDDLLEFKNFGQKSADEVCVNLKKRFDMELRK